MSMMNRDTAFQAELERQFQRRDDLIEIAPSNDVPPRVGRRRAVIPGDVAGAVLFAQGCAQAGLRPLLDLTGVEGASDALPAALLDLKQRAPMIVRVTARSLENLPGVQVIWPENARECAGALRYALEQDAVCVIAENPLTAFSEVFVPDDDDMRFSGHWEYASDQPDQAKADEPDGAFPAYDSVIALDTDDIDGEPVPDEPAAPPALDDGQTAPSGEAPDATAQPDQTEPVEAEPVETAPSEPVPDEPEPDETAPSEPDPAEPTPEEPDTRDEGSAPRNAPARPWRAAPYDPSALIGAADKLGLSPARLMRQCVKPFEAAFSVIIEPDSLPGEVYLPAGGAAMWVGRDRVTVSWPDGSITPDAAAKALRGAIARLSDPIELLVDLLT